jgi:hypothetical protein
VAIVANRKGVDERAEEDRFLVPKLVAEAGAAASGQR